MKADTSASIPITFKLNYLLWSGCGELISSLHCIKLMGSTTLYSYTLVYNNFVNPKLSHLLSVN